MATALTSVLSTCGARAGTGAPSGASTQLPTTALADGEGNLVRNDGRIGWDHQAALGRSSFGGDEFLNDVPAALRPEKGNRAALPTRNTPSIYYIGYRAHDRSRIHIG
jgi:hypothetical protein